MTEGMSLSDIRWLVEMKLTNNEKYEECLKAIEEVSIDLGKSALKVLKQIEEADN